MPLVVAIEAASDPGCAIGVVAARVLVVEDEPDTAWAVSGRLLREGFAVRVAATVTDALVSIGLGWPDLVILDVRPGMLEVRADLQRLRGRVDLPIVMISPMGDAAERIWGLALGADDFVPGPLIPEELVERVRCVLRRTRAADEAPPSNRFAAGPLILDEASRRVQVLGQWVTLTAIEFALLAFLARHPHQAFTREALLGHVWGYTIGDGATVTVHVRRLREKIEADPARPALITTVWGVGYRFDPEPGGLPSDCS